MNASFFNLLAYAITAWATVWQPAGGIDSDGNGGYLMEWRG
jgi:hypothetical protein